MNLAGESRTDDDFRSDDEYAVADDDWVPDDDETCTQELCCTLGEGRGAAIASLVGNTVDETDGFRLSGPSLFTSSW